MLSRMTITSFWTCTLVMQWGLWQPVSVVRYRRSSRGVTDAEFRVDVGRDWVQVEVEVKVKWNLKQSKGSQIQGKAEQSKGLWFEFWSSGVAG